MKSDQYWSQRMELLNESQLAKGEAYIKKMNQEYAKAMASIQRDIDVFYQRFANNNAVSLAAARQMLRAGELQEFKWSVEEYIKRGRENAIDQRWMKELENASIKVRVSRLEALQTQMRQHVEMLAASKQKGITDLLGDKIYKDNYFRSIFEMQKGLGFGSTFAKLDNRMLDNLLTTPWAPDGSNFSSRIWKDRTKLVHELQTTLLQSFIRGDPSERVIKQLAERMGVSRSAAERLVLTEAAYFAGQSRAAAYKETGVEEYKVLATLDKRTSTICRDMDGNVFKLSEMEPGVNYPPFHARCRTTTIPRYEDNIKKRTARDGDGKAYNVPGDMTYKDWAATHAPPDATTPKESAPPIPVESLPVKPVERMQTPPAEGYRKFKTEDEAAEWVDDVSPEWLASLTRDEKAAIRLYSGDSYRDINDLLRSGQSDPQWDGVIQQISSGLQKFDLKDPITAYRGLYHDVYTYAEIGDTLTEAAFVSASLLRGTAFSGDVLLEIRLPAGKSGAAIVALSDYPEEYEFLLDRGTKFRIIDKRKENGKTIYIVEVMPRGEET